MEAETHICKAIETAAKTIADANCEAAEIISNAAAAQQQVDEEKHQLGTLRQELEAEYQAKDADLMRKRLSWLDEMAGVKADRGRLKERLANILKRSIDHWAAA